MPLLKKKKTRPQRALLLHNTLDYLQSEWEGNPSTCPSYPVSQSS